MTTHSTLYTALYTAKLRLITDIIAFRSDPTEPSIIVDAAKRLDEAFELVRTDHFYLYLNRDELDDAINIIDFFSKAQDWFIRECKKLP